MLDELRLMVQLAVGVVFLISASSKVLHPKAFVRGVSDYKLLPNSLAFAIGLLLIPLEIILGISHLFGWLLAYMVPLALVTLICFAIAVGINLKRGRALPCHCFGGRHSEPISARTLARLVLLIAGELFVLTDPTLFTANRLTYPVRVGELELFGVMLLGAVLFLIAGRWILSVPDVVDLFRPCPTCGAQLRTGPSKPKVRGIDDL